MPEPRFEGINKDPFEVELRDKLAKATNANYVGCFDEGGLAIATFENHLKKYFINKKGERIAGPFHHVQPFKEDLARIRKDGGYYFINREGQEVIGPLDGYVKDFKDGLASISVGANIYFINKKGEKVEKEIESYQSSVTEKTLEEWPNIKMIDGKKYLVNKEGKKIAGPFNKVDNFQEDLALVNIEKKGSNYGENYFINKLGKIALGPYSGFYASGFNEGVAVVVDEDRKSYYIDHNGKKVFSFEKSIVTN